MTLSLARNEEAFRLLQDPAFKQAWDDLYEACSWATAFQSFGFVSSWYASYRSVFEPLIAYERLPSGELAGLLCLAVGRSTNEIVVAGTHHAEYQTWLTRVNNDDSFIRSVFGTIRSESFANSLIFKFLPADAPTAGLEAGPDAGSLRFESRSRGVIQLQHENIVASHLKAIREGRTNKYKLNKLKRLGEVRLERLSDPKGVDSVLDELVTFYDLRQAAAHGNSPFLEDPLKKQFHRALADVPGLVHLTVMRAGNQLISGLFGIAGKGIVSLAMPMFSPFYADHSPMIWHVLMLIDRFRHEHVSTFDLTPGADPFKEGFAVERDTVRILTVFKSTSQALRVRARDCSTRIAKAILRRVGIEPSSLKEFASGASFSVIKSALKKVSAYEELRLYSLASSVARKYESLLQLRCDSLNDLLMFPSKATGRSTFIREALRRLAKGQRVYTRVEDGRLQFVGWLSECRDKVPSSEIGTEITLTSQSVLLSSEYLAPGDNSGALCEASLGGMASNGARLPGIKHILCLVPARDRFLCTVLEKLGFVHEQSLFRRTRLGRSVHWSQKISGAANSSNFGEQNHCSS